MSPSAKRRVGIVGYGSLGRHLASCVLGQGEQQEKVKRGKEVRFSGSGNVEVGLRFKKWSEPKQRFLCCPLAHKHCKSPCKGISCK